MRMWRRRSGSCPERWLTSLATLRDRSPRRSPGASPPPHLRTWTLRCNVGRARSFDYSIVPSLVTKKPTDHGRANTLLPRDLADRGRGPARRNGAVSLARSVLRSAVVKHRRKGFFRNESARPREPRRLDHRLDPLASRVRSLRQDRDPI